MGGVADHMRVGDDVAFGVHHHTGATGALGLYLAGSGFFIASVKSLQDDLYHCGAHLTGQRLQRLAEPAEGWLWGCLGREVQRQDQSNKQDHVFHIGGHREEVYRSDVCTTLRDASLRWMFYFL